MSLSRTSSGAAAARALSRASAPLAVHSGEISARRSASGPLRLVAECSINGEPAEGPVVARTSIGER
jgi:hypothetical protein